MEIDLKSTSELQYQMDYRDNLIREIQVLKSRYTPEDTGHLRTAVSVLEDRVKELKDEIVKKDWRNGELL